MDARDESALISAICIGFVPESYVWAATRRLMAAALAASAEQAGNVPALNSIVEVQPTSP